MRAHARATQSTQIYIFPSPYFRPLDAVRV